MPDTGPSLAQLPLETICPSMTIWGCSHTFTFHNELRGATNIHCDEVLTVPCLTVHLHVRKSTLLRTALDRFLRLLIVEKEVVRFRAHKCNSCADGHGDGDGEHTESILHEERQGVKC